VENYEKIKRAKWAWIGLVVLVGGLRNGHKFSVLVFIWKRELGRSWS